MAGHAYLFLDEPLAFDTPSVLRINLALERLADDLKDPPFPESGCMMWLKRIEQNKPGHDERTFEYVCTPKAS